jgi:hypothetical protein
MTSIGANITAKGAPHVQTIACQRFAVVSPELPSSTLVSSARFLPSDQLGSMFKPGHKSSTYRRLGREVGALIASYSHRHRRHQLKDPACVAHPPPVRTHGSPTGTTRSRP